MSEEHEKSKKPVFHQGADSSGYATRTDKESVFHTEKTDAEPEAVTSGQNVPKSKNRKLREKSNVPPNSERLQQGADKSSFADRAKKKQARKIEQSAYRVEKTGIKLESAQMKKAKQKPYKRPGIASGISQTAKFEAWRYVHGKIHQVEHENVGTEAAHRSELIGERAVHGGSRLAKQYIKTRPTRRIQKWQKREVKAKADYAYKKLIQENPALKKNTLSRLVQKQRIKKRYQKQARAAAKKSAKMAKNTATATQKITVSTVKFIAAHPHIFLIAGIVLLLIITLQSCMGLFISLGGGGAGAIGGAAGNAEAIYARFESELQFEIDNMETSHPGYDEYRRNIGTISHNPAELLGFLAVSDSFPENEMESVFRSIFDEQYTLTTREIIESRTETTQTSAGDSIGSVRTTAYCACEICCGPYANGITASGVTAAENRTIAVDAYNPIVPMGTQVFINGRAYIVEDTGNLAANNTDFDIYFSTHEEAMAWGRRTYVAYLAEDTEVTTTTEYRILEITLTAKPFSEAVAVRLTPEQLEQFNSYDYTQ